VRNGGLWRLKFRNRLRISSRLQLTRRGLIQRIRQTHSTYRLRITIQRRLRNFCRRWNGLRIGQVKLLIQFSLLQINSRFAEFIGFIDIAVKVIATVQTLEAIISGKMCIWMLVFNSKSRTVLWLLRISTIRVFAETIGSNQTWNTLVLLQIV